jgi:hypothetical protein
MKVAAAWFAALAAVYLALPAVAAAATTTTTTTTTTTGGSGLTFDIHPDPATPGVKGLLSLANNGAAYAAALAVLGILAGLVLMGVSKATHLERLSNAGKESVVVSFGIGFAINILNALLQLVFNGL